ncbi:MAG TPA: CoA-acylating methylmalonate-semialdehyde dehydrogenase [Bryobacteraceae bacterium]|nr:CoA-acylating methylmalonate-semialdehyde dehydrogenase [Bryobacteraceae bacterium]HOQ45976.1 CoA-acylating methylmalonate-semialdehyde dehydrogenase [Bryobacteraceae bacterium]HPQ14322.1 CoA-acylating methylmalonate-semialdehyde dehydrogenase [Bryobacteraceae bacterium]HPU73813.1 CoA-acylating methylmalonate-semialdehyde dehydrogenase [Bryobacteraceae bacterium]
MIASEVRTLNFYIGGKPLVSESGKYSDVFDPSTGRVIARTPLCTAAEVNQAIESAARAFPGWADTPAIKRVQVLYRFRELIDKHLDELTLSVCTENGKVWDEAQGDVLKAREAVELACGIPSLMMGESMMDASQGYDTTLYREPLGVFAGIAPFNFPAMIPMGWMMPLCIATGNTLVLKAATMTPMTSMRMLELLYEAGLPEGVVNLVTCSRREAEILLTHPAVKGITFVGSTSVGLHVYSTAAAHGKRVQALCEAKNHALVLEDAPLERTARGIINAAYGCAGERCMALPVVAVQESIADDLVALLVKFARERKIGPAYDKTSELGPLVTEGHRKFVTDWIAKGVEEGAELILDGRGVVVPGYEGGFYLGPTIFDHVKPGMSCGEQEIFGPVLCVKRVKDFEHGLEVINANPFANGAVIFTQSGHYARNFAKRVHGGMVGINVGIPVPVGMFPFSGHKQSFFGDLHTLGKDGVRFYTESKCVTATWFDEAELKKEKIDTWDGVLQR